MSEISPIDIRNVISEEDDFGHEMRVANVLRSFPAAAIEHGGTYVDSVTNKPRQFDYRCWIRGDRGRLALAIECKNITPAAPLIVCGAPRSANEAFHDLIESRQGRFEDDRIIYTGLSSVTRRVLANNMFYPKDEFVGKSLLRGDLEKGTVSRSGESEIYDGWSQALSSGVELAKSATKLAKHLSVESVFSAVLPMLVLPNDTLWGRTYDNTGTLACEPNRIDSCAFFVGREIEVGGPRGKPWFQTFTFSHVHFLTLGGLRSFLSKMISDSNAWQQLFVADAAKVSAAYPRDPANIKTSG